MKKQITELVYGYLPNVDGHAPAAKKFRLPSRIALVIRSISEGGFEGDDARKYSFGIVEAVAKAVSAKTILVAFDNEFEMEYENPENVLAQMVEARTDQCESPLYVEFRCASGVAAIIQYGPWAIIGLKPPYDDSYIMEVFTAVEFETKVEIEIRNMCQRLGSSITKKWIGDRQDPGKHINKYSGEDFDE